MRSSFANNAMMTRPAGATAAGLFSAARASLGGGVVFVVLVGLILVGLLIPVSSGAPV